MNGYQKITVIGNLGSDPEKRTTQTGVSVANVSIAVNESFKTKEGEKREKVEWFRCVFWRQAADTLCTYAHKGDRLLVEGKIRQRKYTDNDGVEKYITELEVDHFQFMGGSTKEGDKESPSSDTDSTPLPF